MCVFKTAKEISEEYGIPLRSVNHRIRENKYRTNDDGLVYIFDVKYYEEQRIKAKKTHSARVIDRDGYIYLVKLGKHYKIGKCTRPKKRLKEFTLLPYELEEICIEYVNNHRKIEAYLHHKYKDYRVRGEWFELSNEHVEEIVEYIKSIAVENPNIIH